jgi:hypothetical protein
MLPDWLAKTISSFREVGVSKVKIISCQDACDHCKQCDGQIYPIEDFIRHKLLPNKKCTKYIKSLKSVHCRCDVVAVFDNYEKT